MSQLVTVTDAYWLLSGVVVGGFFGYIMRDLRELLIARNGGGTVPTTSTGGPAEAADDPKRTKAAIEHRQRVRMQVIAALILLAVITSVIIDAVNNHAVNISSHRQLAQAQQLNAQSRQLHKLSECQTNINEQFLRAIKGRATAANQAQDALTHLIGTIPTSAAAGQDFAARFNAALRSYDATIARINAARPKLPPLPDTACK